MTNRAGDGNVRDASYTGVTAANGELVCLGGDFMICRLDVKPWLSPHISRVSILWVKAFVAQKKAKIFLSRLS